MAIIHGTAVARRGLLLREQLAARRPSAASGPSGPTRFGPEARLEAAQDLALGEQDDRHDAGGRRRRSRSTWRSCTKRVLDRHAASGDLAPSRGAPSSSAWRCPGAVARDQEDGAGAAPPCARAAVARTRLAVRRHARPRRRPRRRAGGRRRRESSARWRRGEEAQRRASARSRGPVHSVGRAPRRSAVGRPRGGCSSSAVGQLGRRRAPRRASRSCQRSARAADLVEREPGVEGHGLGDLRGHAPARRQRAERRRRSARTARRAPASRRAPRPGGRSPGARAAGGRRGA